MAHTVAQGEYKYKEISIFYEGCSVAHNTYSQTVVPVYFYESFRGNIYLSAVIDMKEKVIC